MLDFCNQTLVPRFPSFSKFFSRTHAPPYERDENAWSENHPTLQPTVQQWFKLYLTPERNHTILGDPGADSRGEGKSKRAGKYGTKKSKERRKEPLGTMSYQTTSKRSPPLWFLIGARKLLCFSAQSEGRTAATDWNWSGKT